MNLEHSKKSRSIDGQWIKENETKEYKYTSYQIENDDSLSKIIASMKDDIELENQLERDLTPSIQQKNQHKEALIYEIISFMIQTSGFSVEKESISEIMYKLQSKPIEELESLLVSYQQQNIQEETITNGISR